MNITRSRKDLEQENARMRVELLGKKEEMSALEQNLDEMADVLNFTFDRKHF